jgi:hypothetical protein
MMQVRSVRAAAQVAALSFTAVLAHGQPAHSPDEEYVLIDRIPRRLALAEMIRAAAAMR